MVSLDGARAKLGWAQQHFETLRAEIEREPYAIETNTEFDPQTGWHRIIANYMGTIYAPRATKLGLIVGDVIQNTRAALDHLVWQLVIANGKTLAKQQFPIYRCPDDWTRHARKRHLRGVAPHHRAAIQAAQPYNGTDGHERHPLALLDALSNIDKHQVIHATVFALSDDPPKVSSDGSVLEVVYTPGTQLKPDTEIVRIRTDPPTANVQMDDLPFYVAFGDMAVRVRDIEDVGMYVGEILRNPVFAT